MQHAPELQRAIDAEHLRLLRLGYLISAAATAFFALIGLVYAWMALFFGVLADKVTADAYPGKDPPESVVWVFIAFGLGFMSISGMIAGLKLRVARCLRCRTSHTFCVVMSILSCFEIPHGTALGVLSFVVLSRLSVKQEFGRSVV